MLRGHVWTLGPFLSSLIRPPIPPPSRHFRAWVQDPTLGKVRLTGRLSVPIGAQTLLLLVHGLGGAADRYYVVRAAAAAHARGFATLRLNLRGADRTGEDFYHAGLTADLSAALDSPDVAHFERVLIVGFSLGGHVTLRLATEAHDPRIARVAAICPPIDLSRSAQEIDRPRRAFYRRHVLRGLKDIYGEVFARRGGPVSVERAMAIDTLREWDDAIIAPRHGFDDAEDYWARAGVASRLDALTLPALVVSSEADPMVVADTVRPALAASARVETRWVPPDRGGHVGFPRDLDLGVDAPLGLDDQVVGWLDGESPARGR